RRALFWGLVFFVCRKLQLGIDILTSIVFFYSSIKKYAYTAKAEPWCPIRNLSSCLCRESLIYMG
ncbi:MAG: hypothetical protein Q7J67_04120, partial [bacterium]|nr:hypothetical protein [bacterium]